MKQLITPNKSSEKEEHNENNKKKSLKNMHYSMDAVSRVRKMMNRIRKGDEVDE